MLWGFFGFVFVEVSILLYATPEAAILTLLSNAALRSLFVAFFLTTSFLHQPKLNFFSMIFSSVSDEIDWIESKYHPKLLAISPF